MIDTRTALAAIEDGHTVVTRSTRDVVRAQGPDAVAYLQGQISQNVESLGIGATTWSFVLQPQGKVDAWFRLTRTADDVYLIDLEAGFGQQALDRLARFKLRTQIDFDLSAVAVTAVRGVDAQSRAAEMADATNGVAVPAGWNSDGWDVLHLEDADGVDSDTEGLLLAGDTFLEWDRISRGVPAMGAEMDDATIPGATAVVDVSADFTKGCYVGQELVARVDSRGSNTPTKLVSFQASTSAKVLAGASLTSEGNDIGHVTSVASTGDQMIGLGYLKRSAVPDDSDGSLRAEVHADDGTSVEVLVELIAHTV